VSASAAAVVPRRTALRAVPGALPLGAILGALGAASIGLLFGLRTMHLPGIVCSFKLVTGLPCLTCGGTRATWRLLALDPAGALAMNPLAAIGVVAIAAWAAADVALLPRGSALRLTLSPRAAHVVRFGAVAALFANWAYLIAVGR
jgi:Protein of unknown function (DUF2752)